MDNGAEYYRQYLDRNEDAFAALMNLYRDGLIFYLNRFLRDPALAEDLSEDCFVELIVHPHRYRFTTPLKTYLFSIAHHKMVDVIRRRTRTHTVSVDEMENSPELATPFGEVESAVLRSDRDRALYRAMERLAPDYRAVLHLIYFESLSYDQAARIMHKQRKQIENLAYRGRKALRAALEKEGFSNEIIR